MSSVSENLQRIVVLCVIIGTAVGGYFLYNNYYNTGKNSQVEEEVVTEQEVYHEPVPVDEAAEVNTEDTYVVPPIEEWEEKSLGSVTIKYPPHEYCGNSEVWFICLPLAGEGTDFHYAEWGYCDDEIRENNFFGECPFTCGNDFESCVEEQLEESDFVISSNRFKIDGKDAFELEEMDEQFGRLRAAYIDIGDGVFWFVQYNFSPELDEVYKTILNTLEFK